MKKITIKVPEESRTVSDDMAEAKIREAAKELFIKYGSRGTTVRQVAEKAGVQVSMVNYYYRSKDQLFLSIFYERYAEYIDVGAKHLTDRSIDFFERLELYYDSFVNHLAENPDLAMFVISELHFNEKLRDERASTNQTFIDGIKIHYEVERVLNEEYESGRIRKISATEFEMLIISMIVFPFLMSRSVFHLDELLHDQKITTISGFMKGVQKKNILEMMKCCLKPE